jgi:hypothetical protein
MLHVTNGAAAAHGLREAGVRGDVLCWDDVLHEGPVPAGLDEAALREVRSRFVASSGWDAFEDVRRAFAQRDARLALARNEDEVVLWFEHDLYDQLQVVEILARLAAPAARPRLVTQVVRNTYLGTQPADWFCQQFAHRELVPDRAWSEAAAAWAAFTSPDPMPLDALRAELIDLVYLPAALTRHLQEFPSIHTGLSRFEGQLLTALAEGPLDLLAAYHEAHHDREDAIFMGDAVFAWHVARLGVGERPLVARLDGRRFVAPRDPDPSYWEQSIVLTRLGERVLAGQVDRVEAVGVDRWLGGVHLQGRHAPWRWDERQRRLVVQRGG